MADGWTRESSSEFGTHCDEPFSSGSGVTKGHPLGKGLRTVHAIPCRAASHVATCVCNIRGCRMVGHWQSQVVSPLALHLLCCHVVVRNSPSQQDLCLGNPSHCRQLLTHPHCLTTPPLTSLERKSAPHAAPSWALGVKQIRRPKTDHALSRGHPHRTTLIRLPGHPRPSSLARLGERATTRVLVRTGPRAA